MMEANIMAQNIAKNRGGPLIKAAKIAFGLSGVVMALSASFIATSASAKTTFSTADSLNVPYGMSSRADATTPYDAGTRDLNDNRTIINGVIVTGDSLSQNSDGSTSLLGYAIGNQLNVTTTGSNNTVVVDSTQINNGNQTVVINNGNSSTTTTSSTSANTVLNGGLSF